MGKFTVVITRAREQSSEFDKALRELGFSVIVAPSIKCVQINPNIERNIIFERLETGKFDWLVFTSQNGVESFANLLDGKADQVLHPSLKIASQGDRTAQRVLELFKIQSNKIPNSFIGEALVELFGDDELNGASILLISAKETRGVVSEGLRQKGADLTEWILYETVADKIDQSTIKSINNCPSESLFFTFFSPSAFKHFTSGLDANSLERLQSSKIISIGPVTSKAIMKAGFKVFKEAQDHSEHGMIELFKSL